MKNILLACLLFTNSALLAQDFNGTWESLGYGRWLEINGDNFVMKDYTPISCLPSMKGKLDDIIDQVELRGDTLILFNGINAYYFIRVEDLACPSTKKKKKDPIYNFEVLAATFKKHYAYFKERNIDWDEMYTKYRNQIDKQSSSLELYTIIDAMLEEFGDEHIQFDVPAKIEKQAAQLRTVSSDATSPKAKKIPSWQLAQEVANTYFNKLQSRRGGTIRWGVLENNIGYLQVNQMLGFGDHGIDDQASVPEYWKQYIPILNKESVLALTNNEHAGIKALMDEAMSDLQNTQGIILDLRFNGGGKDEVGLEILKRFNPVKKQVALKKAVMDDAYSPEVPIYVEADNKAYTKPVYLLTTRASASATEICVLASLSLPNITRVGGTTEGITSDMLEKTLPNGWGFSLSNELYLDNEGKNYEHVGIAPDIQIYSSDTRAEQFLTIQEGLKSGKDTAIEKAIEHILLNKF